MKISDYPESTQLKNTDKILIETSAGTKTTTFQKIIDFFSFVVNKGINGIINIFNSNDIYIKSKKSIYLLPAVENENSTRPRYTNNYIHAGTIKGVGISESYKPDIVNYRISHQNNDIIPPNRKYVLYNEERDADFTYEGYDVYYNRQIIADWLGLFIKHGSNDTDEGDMNYFLTALFNYYGIYTTQSSFSINTSNRFVINDEGDLTSSSDNSISYIFSFSTFYPNKNGTINLGYSSSKWKDIYSTNGTIQTSDRNEKNSFEDLLMSIVEPFILGLKPMRFKMNSGTSDRFHWGLISQDIEELLEKIGITDLDFAGFIRSPKVRIITEDENGNPLKEPIEEIIEGEYEYSLRYDEFIAPIIKFIQGLYSEVSGLRNKVSILESENAVLKEQMTNAEAKIANLENKMNQLINKLGD